MAKARNHSKLNKSSEHEHAHAHELLDEEALDPTDHGAHDHPHADVLRQASGRALRLALGILGLFFLVELVGGLLTNSLALLSDAFHLLTDVAAVALALLAQWFGSRPPSARRSFGFRRVEVLAALANGATLVIVAIVVAREAILRLQSPPEVHSLPMVIVASVGLVAQVFTAIVLSRAQGESLNVRGAYVHAMTDAVQSVGVVAAGVVMILTGWYLIDPLISLVLAVVILLSAGSVIWEATHVLMEGTPKDVDLHRIAALIRGMPGVSRVTDLHAWCITSGYNALTAHVEADPPPGDAGYEALGRSITHELCRCFPVHHVTLQIERRCEICETKRCGEWLDAASSPSVKPGHD